MHDDKFHKYLADRGHKLTTARQEVFSVLQSTEAPLTNAEIIQQLNGVVDKTSVYRVLELYEAIGVTHRLWNGFKSKSELTDTFSPHHHHFTCQRCGQVTSFKDEAIEAALKRIEQSRGIDIISHLIELNGYCELCRRQPAA